MNHLESTREWLRKVGLDWEESEREFPAPGVPPFLQLKVRTPEPCVYLKMEFHNGLLQSMWESDES